MLEFKGFRGKYYRRVLKYFNVHTKSKIFISKGSSINGATILGAGTRINGPIIIKGSGSCKIGNYSAIGGDVKIITSNHKTDVINLQYALSKRIGIGSKIDERKGVLVGHNVWIGDNCIILPGVSIGNGAVIAAGSVVTRNVDSYSIVAGVPAVHKKFRFSKEKISNIESKEWWNWELNKMKNNIDFFQQ